MSLPKKSGAHKPTENDEARVVSTHTANLAGMTYWGVMGNIPNFPPEMTSIRSHTQNQPTNAHPQKFASSRDAAHSGHADMRYFEREHRFYNLAYKAFQKFALSTKEVENLRLATGLGQRTDDPRVWETAAQPITRAAFGLSFHQVITEWARKTKRTCYCVTIIKKQWRALRDNPRINHAKMAAKIKDVLNEIGFEGILIFEVQGMRNEKRGLHPHFHGIITPRKKGACSIHVAREKLAKAFPNFENLLGVDVKPCVDQDDIEHFLMYAAKSPDKIKRLYKNKEPDSPFKTREGTTGYSARFALDILFVRSSISLTSTIVTHGSKFDTLKEKTFGQVARRLDEWGLSLEASQFARLSKTWESVYRRNTTRYKDRTRK